MSLSYTQPPTISSGALRILTPDFPEEGGGAYAPEAHAPTTTYSTEFLKNTHLQLHAGGQRGVAADVVTIPTTLIPEEADLRTLKHSGNNIGRYDHRVMADVYGGGSFSDLVHPRNSGYGLAEQYYRNEQGPGFSGFQRPPSTIGIGSIISADDRNTNFDPLNSMSGVNFRNAYNQLKQLDSEFVSDDEDVDINE